MHTHTHTHKYESATRRVEICRGAAAAPDPQVSAAADSTSPPLALPLLRSRTDSSSGARLSTNPSTWSNRVANRLSAVKMPPFGPRLYCRQTHAIAPQSERQSIQPSAHASVAHCFRMQHSLARSLTNLLHDLFVVDCVPDVDVGLVGQHADSRVQVQAVGGSASQVTVAQQALTYAQASSGHAQRSGSSEGVHERAANGCARTGCCGRARLRSRRLLGLALTCISVVLPDPAIPMTMQTVGFFTGAAGAAGAAAAADASAAVAEAGAVAAAGVGATAAAAAFVVAALAALLMLIAAVASAS